jgi:hypothetical protein
LAKQKALVEEAKHTTLRLIRSDALVCLDIDSFVRDGMTTERCSALIKDYRLCDTKYLT